MRSRTSGSGDDRPRHPRRLHRVPVRRHREDRPRTRARALRDHRVRRRSHRQPCRPRPDGLLTLDGVQRMTPEQRSADVTEQEGPRTEVTYRVQVKAKVQAIVEATVILNRSDIAKWLEMPEDEVTDAHVQDYAVENDEAVDESMFDLLDIEFWDKVRAEVLTTQRVRITPPGWTPLWTEEHEHVDRAHRDECAAGRCYVDTIVPRSERLNPSDG
uniref:Helix-turn-helix DNA binding domain protein n=2 Tax=unclassified bacterial viruses TaxID=12333 RepID=A0AAU7J7V6_9VIRU